jgi:hypothetical protein
MAQTVGKAGGRRGGERAGRWCRHCRGAPCFCNPRSTARSLRDRVNCVEMSAFSCSQPGEAAPCVGTAHQNVRRNHETVIKAD